MTRKRKRRPGLRLRLEEVPHDTLALEVPVKKYRFDIGPDRRAFVFAIRHEDRLRLSQLKLEQMASVLGNLVHPHFSTLLVVQPQATLEVYEVKLPGDTASHARSDEPAEAAG